MHDNSETSVNSAKALMELSQRKENETKRREAAAEKTSNLSSEQVEFLKKINDLAVKADLEAQESKVESAKSSKRAAWSNIIAITSLLVAIASFMLTYVSSGT